MLLKEGGRFKFSSPQYDSWPTLNLDLMVINAKIVGVVEDDKYHDGMYSLLPYILTAE